MASLVRRNKTYYLQDRLSCKLNRWSLNTDSLQIAKEKLRKYGLDSRACHACPARCRGVDG